MLNPTALLDQAHLQHKQLVQQAEKERLYRQLKSNRSGLVCQIFNQFKPKAKPSPGSSAARIPVCSKL